MVDQSIFEDCPYGILKETLPTLTRADIEAFNV